MNLSRASHYVECPYILATYISYELMVEEIL